MSVDIKFLLLVGKLITPLNQSHCFHLKQVILYQYLSSNPVSFKKKFFYHVHTVADISRILTMNTES